MHFTAFAIATVAASLVSAQSLTIPPRNGAVQVAYQRVITSNTDFAFQEWDSGVTCDPEGNRGPVFILADGVEIKNLIIGERQGDGIV